MSGMSEHTAVVEWRRVKSEAFVDNRYSRRHAVTYDAGVTVALSASPHVVPVPYSDPSAVDPEELFVTSLASCHMLCFLYLAAKAGYLVDSYRDAASGTLGRNAAGAAAITVVTLRPHCEFSGAPQPSPAELAALHDQAHHDCFLASSVHSEIRIEPAL
jgi:organic hydroperoxide reductase OsmC/OhrA